MGLPWEEIEFRGAVSQGALGSSGVSAAVLWNPRGLVEGRHPCGLGWAAGLQTGPMASVPVQAWSSAIISASLQMGIQVSQLAEAFTMLSGQNKKPETCRRAPEHC